MRSLDLGLYELSTNEKPRSIVPESSRPIGVCGGWVGGVGGLGVIIESNLNRVRLSCCWVGVGLGCDNKWHGLNAGLNILQTAALVGAEEFL